MNPMITGTVVQSHWTGCFLVFTATYLKATDTAPIEGAAKSYSLSGNWMAPNTGRPSPTRLLDLAKTKKVNLQGNKTYCEWPTLYFRSSSQNSLRDIPTRKMLGLLTLVGPRRPRMVSTCAVSIGQGSHTVSEPLPHGQGSEQ